MTPVMIPGSCSIGLPSPLFLACIYMICHHYAHIPSTLYRICHIRANFYLGGGESKEKKYYLKTKINLKIVSITLTY